MESKKVNDLHFFIEMSGEELMERKIMSNISIIKHIPHASLEFPPECGQMGEYIFMNVPAKDIYKQTDIGIDDIFNDEFTECIEVKAKYNRYFCDVERFKKNDPMEKYGQGYIYSKKLNGEDIWWLDVQFKDRLYEPKKEAEKYYDEYHDNFNKVVKKELERGRRVLILDIHSYSDDLADKFGNKGPYPDVCIGINPDFNNYPLLEVIIKKIVARGLTYRINFPFQGSILPQGVLDGSIKGEVYSIMLEVNKRLYL